MMNKVVGHNIGVYDLLFGRSIPPRAIYEKLGRLFNLLSSDDFIFHLHFYVEIIGLFRALSLNRSCQRCVHQYIDVV